MVYRKGPTLFFYMCMPSFPNIIFEETVLSPLNDLRTLVKNHWTYIWGFISGLSIVFCVYMCLWDSITLFCLLLLLNQFWNQEMWALYFVSLFEQYFGYLVLLFFLFFFVFFFLILHMYFGVNILFLQKCNLDFDRNCITSVVHFEWYWHINNIMPSNSCTQDAFTFICIFF